MYFVICWLWRQYEDKYIIETDDVVEDVSNRKISLLEENW